MPRYHRDRVPLCQFGLWLTTACSVAIAGTWLWPRLGL